MNKELYNMLLKSLADKCLTIIRTFRKQIVGIGDHSIQKISIKMRKKLLAC